MMSILCQSTSYSLTSVIPVSDLAGSSVGGSLRPTTSRVPLKGTKGPAGLWTAGMKKDGAPCVWLPPNTCGGAGTFLLLSGNAGPWPLHSQSAPENISTAFKIHTLRKITSKSNSLQYMDLYIAGSHPSPNAVT
jgi:hypothetical protein